jgi:arylsulfatase A-like enzyme
LAALGPPLAGLVALAGCGGGAHRPARRPNVVLITLDTTRADRLGAYGYSRRTSPHLDVLARESMLYTSALATSSWTLPAHATLFTGKFTSSHGARYDPAGPLSLANAIEGPRSWRDYRVRGLAPSETTLAELLRREGYATGAVAGGPWLKKPFGLDQGFDYYDDDEIDTANGRLAEDVTSAAVRWIERSREKEFLLFLNYYDPHGPYAAPEPFAHSFLAAGAKLSEGIPRGDELIARYDAEVLYMDHHIGVLLERLKELRLYDETLIVVTSDHGELLGEHGKIGHGQTLYQEELRIPLFVKHPLGGAAPGRSAATVQLTDVLPLVLRALNLPAPPDIQGGLPPRIGHPLVAEVYPPPLNSPEGHWRAIYDGAFKFLWNSKGVHHLYDLATDPGEKVDLVKRQPQRAAGMEALLLRYLESLPRPGDAGPPRELDEETRRALRSLGYVN